MQLVSRLLNLVSALVEYNEWFTKGMAAIAVGLIFISTMAVSLGEGLVAKAAMESIGRQPELVNKIRATMIVGQVMVETSAIYGLIVAIMLTTKF